MKAIKLIENSVTDLCLYFHGVCIGSEILRNRTGLNDRNKAVIDIWNVIDKYRIKLRYD